MRIPKEEVPARVDVPGATARQIKDFGDATGYGKIGGEYFSLSAGTDLAPLLKGLDGDLCQSPHWGYIIEGRLLVGFADGHTETASANDLFYWPPGHTVKAEKDTEMVLFSPQHEHGQVIDHILNQLQAK
ncbi:MAG: cupin domain-containing protein [Desulfobacteraceae bacterium]|nr:MAG: cupin domain-containing protein [Desulfobacteraceae bacterium]